MLPRKPTAAPEDCAPGSLASEGCTLSQQRVAIVRFDPAWSPRSWDDFPDRAQILSVAPVRSRAYAEGMIYTFNRARMSAPPDRQDQRWAVLLTPRAELLPGQHCYRRLPAFDGG